ncbi:hypothetical protein D9M68_938060 [compost metagenome]
MTQRTQQHGAGVVVLQPARIGHEHAALLDCLTELEEAISPYFDHLNHTEGIAYFGDQHRLRHLIHRG